MTYMVKFEGSFSTKEEALAFANIIEGMKGKLKPETRTIIKPEFEVRRSLQVWESTHDEQSPRPCRLIASIDFNSTEKEHNIDGVAPSPELIISPKISSLLKSMEVI